MTDELIDTYDENLEPKGTALKSVAHRTGLWHKSIHCWIVRGVDEGSVLFQRRSATKDLFPNAFDISAAGHYQTGETIADGVREIVEELGLNVPFERLIRLGIRVDLALTTTIKHHEFCETFLLREDRTPDRYDIDPDEVTGLVEVSIPEGLALFSGKSNRATARGVEYIAQTERWRSYERVVGVAGFIPRIDPYYYKIFIMADLMLCGYPHLAI